MTITTTTASSGPYTAVAQTTFAVTFQSGGAGEIVVLLNDVVQSPALYTFTRDTDGTGSVVFAAAVTGTVRIFSDPNLQQTNSYSKYGAWDPSLYNSPLDKAAVRAISLKGKLDALLSPTMLSPTVRASKVLSWDASGNPAPVTQASFTGPTGPAGDVAKAATRTALAAIVLPAAATARYLTETGREGIFVFDTANLSTNVTADPQQGIYVAPAAAPTGASGAWVRKFTGPAVARWWGGTWDGTVNDGPVVLAALTTLFALGGSNLTGYGYAAPSLYIPFAPDGVNMGTTVLSLTKTIAIYGETGGTFGGAATWLEWSGDCNGIEVRAQNCYFDGLGLKGSWTSGSPAEGEYHAIKAYQKFGYGRLYIDSWRGDGIHINVTVGSGGDTEGNCNGTYGNALNVLSCRNGVAMDGDDANACSFTFIDANYCRQAGVLEQSGLGNSYGAIQTSGCGVMGYGTPCCAFNNGHIFTVVSGQATGASTNSPPATATSNTWWLYWKDAAAAPPYAPQWVTAQTWREGGAVYIPTAMSSNSTAIGYHYAEGNQPPVQIGPSAIIKGGLNGAGWGPNSPYITASSLYGGVRVAPQLHVSGGLVLGMVKANDTLRIDGTFNGAAFDTALDIKTGNLLADINFYSSGGTRYAYISTREGVAMWIKHDTKTSFYIAANEVGYVDATGLNLATGKVFSVNGTQVVSARGAAVADATDAASAITQLNAALARLRAHGLIAP